MKPYYKDESVMLYHCRWQDLVGVLVDDSVQMVLTDPPYTENVHKNAKRRYKDGGIQRFVTSFDHISFDDLQDLYLWLEYVCTGWIIATHADDHVYKLKFWIEETKEHPLRFVRTAIWDKGCVAPHVNGDRLPQSWEAIMMLHRNRPGKFNFYAQGSKKTQSVFHHRFVTNGRHPNEKPIGLALELLELFSEPGHTILDPFAGSGAFVEAARNSGRKVIACEMQEQYCEVIINRLQQQILMV